MSSFSYGKHTKKHIGIWLRYRSNPDVVLLVKRANNKRFGETVERVVVSDYDKVTNEVWLEVWCTSLFDRLFLLKHRYNVFYIKTRVNEDWVCEGDLGSGTKF